eukprot:3839653-Rhodomonas_salina.4
MRPVLPPTAEPPALQPRCPSFLWRSKHLEQAAGRQRDAARRDGMGGSGQVRVALAGGPVRRALFQRARAALVAAARAPRHQRLLGPACALLASRRTQQGSAARAALPPGRGRHAPQRASQTQRAGPATLGLSLCTGGPSRAPLVPSL